MALPRFALQGITSQAPVLCLLQSHVSIHRANHDHASHQHLVGSIPHGYGHFDLLFPGAALAFLTDALLVD